MSDIDISTMFEAAFKDAETKSSKKKESKNQNCYKFHELEMCWDRGTITGIYMIDSHNKLFRIIDNLITGRVKIEKDGKPKSELINWIPTNGYSIKLTDDQVKLSDELKKQIDDYKKNYPEEGKKLKEIKRMTIFYMVVTRFVKADGTVEEYTEPCVTLLKHRSFGFTKDLHSAIDMKKSVFGSSEWMKDYFNRGTGERNCYMIVKTEQDQGPYKNTISFESLGKKVNINEDLLSQADDLNSEVININEFNEENYKHMIQILTDLNNAKSDISSMQSLGTPSPKIEDKELEDLTL